MTILRTITSMGVLSVCTKQWNSFRQKTGFANHFNANHLTQCLAHGKDLDTFGLLGELWLPWLTP